jgi:hypothetical protein
VIVKTELVVPSEVEVRLEGMSIREDKAELSVDVGSKDWDGSSRLALAIEVSTVADTTAEGAVMGSMEDSEGLDKDASEAVSSADGPIPDTLEDGPISTDDEAMTRDDVGIRVEVSEDADESPEAGIVEEARSWSWDVREGVFNVLDTDEDSAEGDTVAMEAPSSSEDEGSRIAGSEMEDGSAEGVIEGSSSWVVDVGEERSELDTSVKEAVMLGPFASLALILDPIDSVGWADSEAGNPPSSPFPSTNTIQNLWLGSSTNTKHFCSITPTDLTSANPQRQRTFHSS